MVEGIIPAWMWTLVISARRASESRRRPASACACAQQARFETWGVWHPHCAQYGGRDDLQRASQRGGTDQIFGRSFQRIVTEHKAYPSSQLSQRLGNSNVGTGKLPREPACTLHKVR